MFIQSMSLLKTLALSPVCIVLIFIYILNYARYDESKQMVNFFNYNNWFSIRLNSLNVFSHSQSYDKCVNEINMQNSLDFCSSEVCYLACMEFNSFHLEGIAKVKSFRGITKN